MTADFGRIVQQGYVVPDAEAAARVWAERTGAGPFYVMDHALDGYVYRGVPTPLSLRIAFGYWADMQIELIQPLSDADSLYSRALATDAGKLNHYACLVDDLDGLLVGRGLQDRVLQSGQMPTGLKFVYLEEFIPGGLHLELIQPPPSTLAAFQGMEALARRWDGRDPVRSGAALAEDLAALAKG
ncbi:VOC family protein [Phenylobacterium sp. LjRoot219]|uniref:VOC family protein n=1 Tax=Phenylobacterium sp. LjRoot219 TaxID=3342283 RepID=UPI003ECC3197